MRDVTSIIEISRDLMAAVAPTTGTRATGQLRVNPIGNESIKLPRNWHLIPIINGAAREDLLFKVALGPETAKYPNGKRVKVAPDDPDTDSWWVVQPGGSIITVTSVLGGARHNLPKGTKFIFDPVNPLAEAVELYSPTTGGIDPPHHGGLLSVVEFEQLNGASPSLDAFRAKVGDLPAAVIVWDGSEPADGTTQSTLSRGETRVGRGSQLYKEKFNLFVMSERLDSGQLRRSEGLKALDDLTHWLTDRQEVDGQIFSTPSGVHVRGRNRIAGDSSQYQSLFVYVLQIAVTTQLSPYSARTYTPWLRSNIETHVAEKDASNNNLEVVNLSVDMPQN